MRDTESVKGESDISPLRKRSCRQCSYDQKKKKKSCNFIAANVTLFVKGVWSNLFNRDALILVKFTTNQLLPNFMQSFVF